MNRYPLLRSRLLSICVT